MNGPRSLQHSLWSWQRSAPIPHKRAASVYLHKITQAYPREVVKGALRHNAAAVIFAHNHPSGVAEPSHADEILTRSLKSALALVDIQVLDHFIVAGSRTMSFAERGLL